MLGKSIYFQIIITLPFIILCQNVDRGINDNYFIYPYSITLANGNIFIIHKLGIEIYDSFISNLIKTVLIFSDEEKISTKEDYAKVTLRLAENYIISIINDYVYIFDSEGNFLFKSLNKIIDDQEIEYYSLVFHKIKDNLLYYSIQFFDNNNYLNLIYYNYNPVLNSSTVLSTKISSKFKDYYTNDYDFINKGLSCEYIYSSHYSDYLITCFFVCNYRGEPYLSVDFYWINSNDGITDYENYSNDRYKVTNATIIKTGINYHRNLTLVCFYDKSNDTTTCLKYNISSKTFCCNFSFESCRNKIYALKINYIPDKKQIIFSSLIYERGIYAYIYDNNLNPIYNSSLIQLTACEVIYGHSIIYLNNTENYYILSDAKCNNTRYILTELMNDKLEEKAKINTNKEKEEEEEKTGEEEKGEEEKGEEEKGEEDEEEENQEEERQEEEKEVYEMEKMEEEEKEKEIEKEEYKCIQMEKCKLCGKDSLLYDLCIECNNNKNYFPITKSLSQYILSGNKKYIDCFNEKTKPTNFYLNINENYYEPCYEKCATCEYGGDGNEHNCTSCENNYVFNPDFKDSKNCVQKCKYFYYYNKYGEYKCTPKYQCPEEYNIFIKEKKKCTNDCRKEDIYKFYYNGECLKECKNYTKDNNDFYCRDTNLEKCFLTQSDSFILTENITEDEIEKLALKYVKEFNYTKNHVSIYKNKLFSIAIYKNGYCISNLNISIQEIDFGECYKKLQDTYKINDNLVIAIINKIINGLSYSKILSYSMFEPYYGEVLLDDDICKNDKIIVKENLLNKLDENIINITSLLFLTGQNIDVFNISSRFYNDICFHFDPPLNKDITLKDRIALYYPNITICENDCIIKDINLTTLQATCECNLNNIKNTKIFGDDVNKLIEDNFLSKNLFYQNSIGEIENIINNINIQVIKCYKDIFIYKYFIANAGGFIILSLLIIEIFITIIFFRNSINKIKRYIFDITNSYHFYLSSYNPNKNISSCKIGEEIKSKSGPPRKKKSLKNISILHLEKIEDIKIKKKKRKKSINMIKLSDNSIKLSNSNGNEMKLNSKNILMNISNNNNKNNNFSSNQSSNSIDILKLSENRNIYKNLFLNPKDNLNINIEEYLKTDIDDMDYEDSNKKDKRKFCEYFIYKLKLKQILLNTFCVKDPLRPLPIKLLLLVLEIDLYFFINGLFFNEDYISEVFHTKDDETLFEFAQRIIDNCLYTTLTGVIISYIIDFFFIEEKKLKGILKREKNNLIILNYEITRLIKNMQKRYLFFVIISLLIICFTWYYVSCFNNIYPFVKIEWIETSIIIIIIMQLLPIFICLFETIIRFISFKCKSEKMYKISRWIS